MLHAYCHVHRLDTPPAFVSPYNQRMLTRPGIGQHSPTMARHRARRRISKGALALAVRKDFNAAIVLESELITSFLYAVKNQGKHHKRLWESTRHVVDSLRRQEFPYAIRAVTDKIVKGVEMTSPPIQVLDKSSTNQRHLLRT